jgi:hypothetical protein
MTPAGSVPEVPPCRALKDRIAETLTGMGVHPPFGVKLQMVLRRAGLSAPRLTLGAPPGGADAIGDLDLRCRDVAFSVPHGRTTGLGHR